MVRKTSKRTQHGQTMEPKSINSQFKNNPKIDVDKTDVEKWMSNKRYKSTLGGPMADPTKEYSPGGEFGRRT